ncbi:glycosyl hydrolase-related protein [Streptomyces sp. NBC_00825]|uniref:alpha-mannosidase n=1 Tax=unclassified Streptomyces TaxID=2593676 RepID=UPI00225C150A|nr:MULTISPECIES: glycoside hydrolase family 38 C-terminal domain-containing protein [unclassified Streptomyces]WTB57614.1 glycosyl hydrolase-related protein [Streptomyces sp. NBC_00826]WTH89503.1 glycosyl hydrolase-related protein [Streptomyces sp. NBC_00825]WTH98230.1 glycosyl hydrolase-related protein [Streptomyces sp. NBC_00822]MCX4863582.1 glycosyl hydrolase-related protein [Streptomyces sp. NBC_00906]MCX4894820.1 glycosyl hydrolase-related protein [Streptomyces sp. NBC_00892]
MHDDRTLVEDRLERALHQFIRPAQYSARTPLALSVRHVPGEPVPVARVLQEPFEPFRTGTEWGKPWSTSWFRLEGTVPTEWAGCRAEVVVDPGFSGQGPGFQAEGMLYDTGGVPLKGIHPRNRHLTVAAPAAGGEPVALLLEAAANPAVLEHGFAPTLLGDVRTAGERPLYRFASADLAVLDEEVWHLVLDIEVLSELMRELPVERSRRHEILRALERMLDALDLHDVAGTARAGREQLAEVLSRPAEASAHRISAAGHAHIDSAWLWPLRETVRKASRTFANVTALARDYPELVFAASQAQQYAWVKEHQPHIWERIKQAVAEGQWAPVGSMWVESDANMPGGEALARQLVHGKRFFRQELGVETEEIWLPDTFGYTAAFPQLARLAGVKWFLTQKLSWNQSNKMPHHTFWWEGIDGTRVFTHFPPVDTYNAQFHGSELAHAERNFAEKGPATRSLVPFGWGDGGGGPTREMLEKARRLRNLEGSPRVTIERPAAFFAAAEEEYGAQAPVWSGELYLELHRATYTTQAKTKQGNRRSEHLLREAELWATTAALRSPGHRYHYPYEALDRLWKTVLLHQFHDILPGSSIAWVHREARETYERVRVELADLVADAVAALGGAKGLMVLNSSPYHRRQVVELDPEASAVLPSGAQVQHLAGGRTVVPADAPGLGAGPLNGSAAPEHPVSATGSADGSLVLDNGLLRLVIDADGLIAAVRDLGAGRDVLVPGHRANLLQLHPDHPNHWDAWDIDRHYRRTRTDLADADSVELVEEGPLRAAVRVRRSFGQSHVTQEIRLGAGSRRIDIETEVNWRESEKVLKAAFPLDVHAERSTSEIQFGHVHRPTHDNTGWDAARFEICAHRWLRVAEPGYGVTLLNDSTYGHDVTRTPHPSGLGTTVRLTLLRAPRSPDPETDLGRHRFRYALAPGGGITDAVREGLALNLPLRAAVAPVLPSLVDTGHPAVTVESVKLAEDRGGDVIVRLYESAGGRAGTTLRVGFPVVRAQVTDLLERPLHEADTDEHGLVLSLRPFQILTLRLTPA